MTPETLAPPDMTRFTSHKDDLVAFEASVIVALAVYVMFLHWLYGKTLTKFSDAIEKLSPTIVSLTEVVRAKKD